MDPLHCTLFVLYEPPARPFVVEDIEQEENEKRPPYMDLLRSVFGRVHIVSSVNEPSTETCTLYLIDIDALQDYVNVHSLIQKMAIDPKVPVVVCSFNDSPSSMLECIRAGAADYLLKPLRLDVVKTLYLNLHRWRPVDCKMHEHVDHKPLPLPPLSFPSSPISVPDQFMPDLNQRIQDILDKDSQLTKTVMEIYVPRPLSHAHYSRLSSHRAAKLREKVASWDFCPFEFDHDDLIHCVFLMLESTLPLPEFGTCSVHEDQLYRFILDLSNAYHHDNPYHNFAHAVDVLQCLYHFLCRLGILPFTGRVTYAQSLLRPKDVFALLIAAIGHDAAHPGVNNMFLINTGAPLAQIYNDRSVLESLHSMTLFQVLQRHGIDQLVGGAGSKSYQEFRQTVVSCVLSTDMALHRDYVGQIKDLTYRLQEKQQSIDDLNSIALDNERLLICNALIKCADISNVARPFRSGSKWAKVLMEEFTHQGDLERQLGIPVQPMNDRDKIVLEDMQIDFIRFVALDLFERVCEVLPNLAFAVDHIRANLDRWEHRKSANHDSGVSSLDDLDLSASRTSLTGTVTTTTTTTAPSVRQDRIRSSKEDYGQAALTLHPRLSIDTSPSLFKLPAMPALAMTDFHSSRDLPSPNHDWPHAAQDAAYCQCAIQ